MTLLIRTALSASALLLLAAGPLRSEPPEFSTFLGGGQRDFVRDVAVAPDGSIVLAGGTASATFPSTPGSADPTWNGVHDAFVVKLDAGGHLVWSTFLGGPNYDRAYAVEVDEDGFVYVAGRAGAGFPTTPGVLQPAFAGDGNPVLEYGLQDGFVAKLTPDGRTVVWATYFGDSGPAAIRDIAVGRDGTVYLVQGEVHGAHPHVTAGAFQTRHGGGRDCVVAHLSADGRRVLWGTYLGGSGDDGLQPSVRIDSAGNVYSLGITRSTDAPVTPQALQTAPGGGSDLLLTKLSPDGSTLLYGTYLGGSGFDGVETHNLWVGYSGLATIAMTTRSVDLPVTAGAFQPGFGGAGGAGTGNGTNYPGDGFVARITADGRRLIAATYLGGRYGEGVEGCTVDAAGSVYVTGTSFSGDFPTGGSTPPGGASGGADFFLAKLSADLKTLEYGTLFGGAGDDYGRTVAVTRGGDVLVGGQTRSDNWPLTGALQSTRGGDWDGAMVRIPLSGGAATGVPETEGGVGEGAAGLRISPNPSAGDTVIGFALERAGRAELEVLDVQGRRIRRLARRTYPAGRQAESWDGRDDAGRPVVPGLYLIRLRSEGRDRVRKAVRIRG